MRVAFTSDTHYGFSEKTHQIHLDFLSKLKNENADLLIHAGDWASNTSDQFQRSVQMFRNILESIPVLSLLGNHDLWEYKRLLMFNGTLTKTENISVTERILLAERSFSDNFFNRLSDLPLVLGDIAFFGFDGWYSENDPFTNDFRMMPGFTAGIYTNEFLKKRSFAQVNSILQKIDELKKTNVNLKIVVVSHFDGVKADPRSGGHEAFQALKEKCDFIFYGHNHKFLDEFHGNCRVLRCGSDYDHPMFLCVDI